MDVLRPQIVVVSNRCYRKNPINKNEVNTAEEDMFTDDVTSCVYNDEVCDAFSNIEETENGFRILLNIPSAYFKFIIGKKAENKKKLELETRTQIRIPKAGQEGEIVILGHDRKGVSSAKTRIDVIVESARQKQPFTHFLSICINNIEQSFVDFKTDVLRECDGDRSLEASLFQNPKKLHLTLGTLALLNDAEITMATELLQQCKEDLVEPILKGQKLLTRVQDLEYMNDDPNAVDVLYAAQIKMTDASHDVLQILCDRLVDKFSAAGLMPRQFERVKLHVTVMNTLFRKDPTGTAQAEVTESRRNVKEREFDAAGVLRKFGKYDFGPQEVTAIHLSKRYSTGQDGYYDSVGSISLI
ncbi:LOW QUALITY PROTEIN: activating signal cointegrator 1 complex subunit 1-like [Haliotis rubra]|uniref:LOW QUALITY PROTEIN: activating signal cointegrator 1 complex subunit 1-like n=1 Tax=Haliotis rubra TaxID=36100 RepID=UPI001EE5EBF2|nr:LOW QUALITY PROTEIN: activating signal cointegrator 1 complex subunit 1-like [Haliotis rubra]